MQTVQVAAPEVGEEVTFSQLTRRQQNALRAALKVLEASHNFYSSFSVGAALVSDKGKLITGTNFENAAYGSTVCAERAAVLQANTRRYRDFEGIAIIARKNGEDVKYVTSPCGSCRQVLFELAALCGHDLYVVLSTTDRKKIVRTTARALLPLGFGPDGSERMAQYRKEWSKQGRAAIRRR